MIGQPYMGLLDKQLLPARDMVELTAGIRDRCLDHQTAREELEGQLRVSFEIPLTDIGAAISEYYGVPYFHLQPTEMIKPVDLLNSVKRGAFKDSSWLPLSEQGNVVYCVTHDMDNRITKDQLNPQMAYPGKKIAWSVTTIHEFHEYVKWLFGESEQSERISEVTELDGRSIDDLVGALDVESEGDDEDSPTDPSEDNEIVKIVNKILIEAYQMGASDIHVEPTFRGNPANSFIRIRFRKDGSMREYTRIPYKYRSNMIARIKIMAALDIAEKRRPQDGKFKVKHGGKTFELRLATHPSVGGVEDAVMRILASSKPLPLDKMGFTTHNLNMLMKEIVKPYGLIFVCGPTGSGKTTTLHSILGYLNTVDTKILTAEDPVEISQEGLRQVQINKKAGLDFPAVMKSFLRCDPDIIMVGEMRDQETIKIGIEASLTGHLVFSTLHTNSAPESITRLIDMGVDPFNFADALLGILAQRLGKTLCPDCKVPYYPEIEEIKTLVSEYSFELKETSVWKEDYNKAAKALYSDWLTRFGDGEGSARRIKIFKKNDDGCPKCEGTGYRGRVGLHELMIGTDDVKAAIQRGARPAEIAIYAMESGMRTLKQDGIEKVLEGKTDMHQVRAVCIK